jgi:hypothetical protein
MARKYGKISYTPCRGESGMKKGKFVQETSCGRKRKPKKTAKKSTRKSTASKSKAKKATGFYRDKGGFCRKKGKRGFASESSCKRAGK